MASAITVETASPLNLAAVNRRVTPGRVATAFGLVLGMVFRRAVPAAWGIAVETLRVS